MCFDAVGLIVVNFVLFVLVPVYFDRLDLRDGVIRCLQHKRGDEGGEVCWRREGTRYWYSVALWVIRNEQCKGVPYSRRSSTIKCSKWILNSFKKVKDIKKKTTAIRKCRNKQMND